MDCKNRIEQIGESNPVGLRNQTKQRSLTLEAPYASGFGDFESRLAVTVKELAAETTGRVLMGQLNDLNPCQATSR